jgi:UTP--glucose-1-phosphate uridylyltransferase
VSLDKAIIPAAGFGTRMLPVTRTVPKELLPVGSKPAIHWAVEEAAAAGLYNIAVVVSRTKPLIAEYLESGNLAGELGVSFQFIVQEEQLGLADAIWCCREFAAGDPYGLLLPDNVVASGTAGFTAMADLFRTDGRDVFGVLELDSSHSLQYGHSGLIDFEPRSDGALEISRLADKRPGRLEIAPGETAVRTCGRYVCTPDLLDGIGRLRESADGELDEVPVYQQIIGKRGALGVVLPPPLFDVGYPRGFTAANAWWLAHLDGQFDD